MHDKLCCVDSNRVYIVQRPAFPDIYISYTAVTSCFLLTNDELVTLKKVGI